MSVTEVIACNLQHVVRKEKFTSYRPCYGCLFFGSSVNNPKSKTIRQHTETPRRYCLRWPIRGPAYRWTGNGFSPTTLKKSNDFIRFWPKQGLNLPFQHFIVSKQHESAILDLRRIFARQS